MRGGEGERKIRFLMVLMERDASEVALESVSELGLGSKKYKKLRHHRIWQKEGLGEEGLRAV